MPYIVVATDRRLMPPRRGNRTRILGLIRCLRSAGYRIALVAPSLHGIDRLETRVDAVFPVDAPSFNGGNIDRFNVAPYRRMLRKVVAAVGADAVIAEYAWMTPAMGGLPKYVLRCVDCHDVLHERSSRFRTAGLDPWVYCSPKQERRLLDHADVLLAIQVRDAAVLKSMLPRKKVVCVTPFLDLPKAYQPGSPDTRIVLAVGADHAGNEGIRRFADVPWAQVVAKLPDARLRVVGGIAARLSSRPNVELIGEVEDVSPYYAEAAVVVCPVTVGTGLKIKIVEALRLGKAVVATPAAAEGLASTESGAWVTAECVSACAQSVVALLTDRAARKRLEDSAFAFGRQHLSAEVASAQLRGILPNRLTAAFRRLVHV